MNDHVIPATNGDAAQVFPQGATNRWFRAEGCATGNKQAATHNVSFLFLLVLLFVQSFSV